MHLQCDILSCNSSPCEWTYVIDVVNDYIHLMAVGIRGRSPRVGFM
jgi:hypothetical protein